MDKKTIENLEKKGFHHIEISNLLSLIDPLSPWYDAGPPIDKQEVFDCIKKGEASLEDTPFCLSKKEYERKEIRYKHIQKIAYFVLNEIKEPIHLEPESTNLSFHMISDGNHRLAGRYLAGDSHINAHIFGDITFAKDLGLWNPNTEMKKLLKHYDQEYLKQKEKELQTLLKKIKNNMTPDGVAEINMSDIHMIDRIFLDTPIDKSFIGKAKVIFDKIEYQSINEKTKSFSFKYNVKFSKKERAFLFSNKRKNKISI